MILNMVLWSFITLASIILLMLFIPYRLAVAGHVQWQEGEKTGNATIHLGGAHRGITISPFPNIRFGFGNFDNPLLSFSLPKKKESPVKKENSKKQKTKTKKKIPYFKIGESTMGEIHFDQFYLNGDIGLPNPMHTGIIYGWSQSLRNLIRSKKFDIEINPQFNNRFETDIRGQFRLRFTPGKVLWQAGKTYFKYKK
jgi:hypothetical protein